MEDDPRARFRYLVEGRRSPSKETEYEDFSWLIRASGDREAQSWAFIVMRKSLMRYKDLRIVRLSEHGCTASLTFKSDRVFDFKSESEKSI
ncbi:MAG: hypothetical protein AAB495_02835 [Patescibacteria group bacterium]